MSCGCKNCNGTVSQTASLPPGCDSILNITSETVGQNILVTITFCSGTTQQFSIPIGSDGAPGSSGPPGASGSDGVGIADIDSSVVDNTVTLTFTLTNGQTFIESFSVDPSPSAYIVEHKGLDIPLQDNLEVVLNSAKQVIATSTIPAGTLVNNGDTVYFDLYIKLNYVASLSSDKAGQSIFRDLTLEFNNTQVPSTSGANIEFSPGAVVGSGLAYFPTFYLKFTGSITRRLYGDPLGFLQNGFDVVAEGQAFSAKNPIADDFISPEGGIKIFPDGINIGYSLKTENININADQFLKLTARAEDYTVNGIPNTVTTLQTYFTTKYIPKI